MTTMAKARILVTRHLPVEVEKRLEQDFAAELNVGDKIMTTAEIVEKAKDIRRASHHPHGPMPEGAHRRSARVHPDDCNIFGRY